MAKLVQEMDGSALESKVLKAKKPAVVDFWAAWCYPCKMMTPVIEDLAREYQGRVLVGNVDLDQHPDVAARFNVMNIPTIIFFKNGQEHSRLVGVTGGDEVIRRTEEIL